VIAWLLAVLLGTQLIGYTHDGQPVTFPTYTVEQLQPEYDRLIRRRNGEALLELRQRREVVTADRGSDTPVPVARPPSPPVTTPPQGVLWRPSVERWRGLVDRYFTGVGESERALGTIRCESLGDPDMVTPPYAASGLFQHLAGYWDERAAAAGWAGASIFDPEANIAVAAWLVHTDGWQHWNACNRWVCAQGVC